jgi:pyruvate/2-oxoglutarate dehydrogenase complex dihydrolipoamide dehydrogenase (E3) component
VNISIVGSGYVGTTIAACFADLGHSVVNVDIDEEIVETINDGRAPIHEPSLGECINDHAGEQEDAQKCATRELGYDLELRDSPREVDGEYGVGESADLSHDGIVSAEHDLDGRN